MLTSTGQRTETKAITVYPVNELLGLLPKFLHPAVRSSKYYTAGNDSLTFSAQTHRSRSANLDENKRKLIDEVMSIYRDMTPAETSSDKKKKFQEVYVYNIMGEKRSHQADVAAERSGFTRRESRTKNSIALKSNRGGDRRNSEDCARLFLSPDRTS